MQVFPKQLACDSLRLLSIYQELQSKRHPYNHLRPWCCTLDFSPNTTFADIRLRGGACGNDRMLDAPRHCIEDLTCQCGRSVSACYYVQRYALYRSRQELIQARKCSALEAATPERCFHLHLYGHRKGAHSPAAETFPSPDRKKYRR